MENNQKETNTIRHGFYKHRLYKTWDRIKQRCDNPNDKNYKNYGARGIKVCDRWHSVENFINDMYPTFQDGLSIDRIDNDGNYEPNNCRWVSKNIQSRNKRTIQSNNKSGYKGVCWHKNKNKWRVQIKVNSKTIYIGQYSNIIEAALAYDQYVIDNNLEHTRNFN